MLWLVPAAVAAGVWGWVDARPKPQRASWEMDLGRHGWSRALGFAMTFFAFMAGSASTDSHLSVWVCAGLILVATGVPLGVASLVGRRWRRRTSAPSRQG